MNDAPKKRLQLMPEVLPAPTRAQTTGVRNRTLSHMQRLLATAAAIPLASCTRTDTQETQTVTLPSATASATAQSTTEGTLLPPKEIATAQPTATAPDMGYAVVDPMPAPARCMGLANATVATAVFKKDAGGIYLEITAALPTAQAWTGTTFTAGQTPSAWSGTVIGSQVTSHKATVKIRPSASVQNLGVQLAISCAAGSGSLAFSATFPASPTETTKASLQKNDY
ncbi:MAG TPA: hypothetical protein VGH87_15595 [Polyangiaceae bacterium]|jgi:hypothetical protein